MKYIDKEVQVPLVSVSMRSGLENKTGSWKFARPVFIDRVSPCIRQCPAGEDIAGYMYLAGQERFHEAWQLIMEENPFPATMGRVCFHTCEEKCNRKEHDQGISIHAVERFVGDYAISHNLKIIVGKPEKHKKVAVVGAGPGGLSAAYHIRRMGYHVTVFDSNQSPGGMMRYGIPAYRLPREVLDAEIDRLYEMGIEFKAGVRAGKEITWDFLYTGFDAVFIATGAWDERKLGIEGVEKKGVFRALDFLNEVNMGNMPEAGKRIAVIGGGNSAIDCARSSRRLGADVTVAYRRSRVEMPAHSEEIEMAEEEGVKFLFLAGPGKIYGNETVLGIRLEKMALGDIDGSGRRRPMHTGDTLNLDCDSIIMAIGECARLDNFSSFVSCDGAVVKVDGMGRTSKSGVFAGGDITGIPHTVTHAIGSGKRTALAIDEFLAGTKYKEKNFSLFTWGNSGSINLAGLKGSTVFPRRNQIPGVVEYKDINPFYFDHRPGIKINRASADKRLKDFREVVEPLSVEDILYEARRCFICGSCSECGNCFIFCPEISVKANTNGRGYIADMDYCKGCGICVHECPRGAIRMEFME